MDSGQHGIALTIPKHVWSSLVNSKPVSCKLLTARHLHKHDKITVTIAYAPTNIRDEDIKDAYYSWLQSMIKNASPTWDFHCPDWCQCSDCILLPHDALEQPCVIGNTYNQSCHLWQWKAPTPTMYHSTRLCIVWHMVSKEKVQITGCSTVVMAPEKKWVNHILISNCWLNRH